MPWLLKMELEGMIGDTKLNKNFALMAFTSSGSSSSSDSDVDSCSKSCVIAYATLKEQYDNLSSDYKKSQFNLVSYKAVIDKFKTGLGYNAASSTSASPTVENFVNSSEMLENQENNKSKYDKGYHAVLPPFTGNFIPRKPDLTFMDEIVKSENMDVTTVGTPSNIKKVESNLESAKVKSNGDAVEPKTIRKNVFRPPFIEDWNSDDDSEVEFIPNVEDKTVRPSTKKIKFVKRFIPRAVLTKSGKIITAGASVNISGTSVNIVVRPVNTVGSKTTMNHPISISNAYKKGYSQVTRPFNKYSEYKNSIFNKKDNTVRVKDTTTRDRAVVSEKQGIHVYNGWIPKESISLILCVGKPQQKEYKNRSYWTVSCSRHMIGNKCYLMSMKEYDGGLIPLERVKDGKQTQASYKTKLMNSINKPLHMLHMDLFGPTNVKSLMKKSYCLVVIDDFSRFSWVLRGNSVLLGLLSRNGVAERRNRTLLEDARTMFTICTTNPLISQDPKVSVEYAKEKPTKMDESGASNKDREENPNSTISINIVSTHVSTARQSCTDDDPSSPVNTAEASNAFEEHLFERFSPFKNTFTLPPVSNVTIMDDTRIFGNANDDECNTPKLGRSEIRISEACYFSYQQHKIYIERPRSRLKLIHWI
ncbi:ribonuclease H-like domain-containing protein [Tanacetum coccineum]